MVASAHSRQVNISSGPQLQSAMENALPGDSINLAPGTYTATRGSTSGENARGMFFSKRSGTSSAPITVRAQDMSNKPTLIGKDASGTVICLYLKGTAIDSANSTNVAYWNFDGVNVLGGQKGVVFDACQYVAMKDCSVSNIDQEGIHIRDNSSFITIESSSVCSTGRTSAGYGEAFYIGSDKSSQGIPPATSMYRPFCNSNTIRNCTVGPGVSAEHFDVKEGTYGNIIEYNTFDGSGISGANSANTFINDKAQGTIIRFNVGNKNGNDKITAFGDVSARGVYQSGSEGWWYSNTFNGASTTDYMIAHAEGKPTAYKWTNAKPAGGNMYDPTVDWTDKNPNSAVSIKPYTQLKALRTPPHSASLHLTRKGSLLTITRFGAGRSQTIGADGKIQRVSVRVSD